MALVIVAIVGFLLNMGATISAAISAYYSREQASLAIAAVDAASKNQAFAEFIQAQDNLCKVSLTHRDQLPDRVTTDSLTVITADYDAAERDRSSLDVDAYMSTYRRAAQLRDDKYLLFSLFIGDFREEAIYDRKVIGSDDVGAYRSRIMQSKSPPEIEVMIQNLRCTFGKFAAVAYFKSRKDISQVIDFGSEMEFAILPQTKGGKTVKDMLTDWGRIGDLEAVTLLR